MYYYVSLNRDYLNIFFMGIYMGVINGYLYMPLNRAYLNILTLFFYKCVWSRQTQISRIKFFHYGGTQAMKPGMVKTEITTLRWSFMLCCKAWVLIVKCNCKLVTYGAVWTISRVGISFLYCVYIFKPHNKPT